MVKLSKVELDISRHEQVNEGCELATVHSMPAVVVNPDLVAAATIARGIKRGKFAIIASIDWPRGDQYEREKFRGVPSETMNADGYEILLTNRPTFSAVLTEIQYLSNFIRNFIPNTQLRFVVDLPARPESYIKDACTAMKRIPLPYLVRTTHNTRIQVPGKELVQTLNEQAKLIRSHVAVQVKVSGNLNHQVIQQVKSDWFAASIQQTHDIVAEISGSIPKVNANR